MAEDFSNKIMMTESADTTHVTAVRWEGDAKRGHLALLDQRLLPHEEHWVAIDTVEETAKAIQDMLVRGAPAIGLTAAYGLVLAAQEHGGAIVPDAWERACALLAASRPTAVNLHWAIDRMRRVAEAGESVSSARLLQEAQAIRDDDRRANRAMGEWGASLLPMHARVLTHCNTGALATSGIGTALGVIRCAHGEKKLRHVYATETRPYMQGARLTMWELLKEEIPATLITDSMAAWLMAEGKVDAVCVGADRIAANGDTANKIGTYGLAILAQAHAIPFYVVAPISTIDPTAKTRADIPIEMRPGNEVMTLGGVRTAPMGAEALHPAFDVTPGEQITAIVTEKGIFRAPYRFTLSSQR